ncbi:MAG TPA: NAD(P)-binding domain-containing protein, partial [Candidatus Udaeobacter sp.]|nr:NAD(P)-binding domain-containing protein [Candidatus Udaeobacter sp.]
MQIGMIGLGRMGANMVRRLLRGGHECVVNDRNPEAVQALVNEGATGAASLDGFIAKLKPPRAIWLMIPAALVDTILHQLVSVVAAGDVIIDGGNSYYIDDIRRARELKAKGIHYV